MLHSWICESYHEGLTRASKVSGVTLLGKSSAAIDPTKTHAESVVLRTDCANFRKHPELAEEVFGPFAVLISASSIKDLEEVAQNLEGQLTATVHGTAGDLADARALLKILERKA